MVRLTMTNGNTKGIRLNRRVALAVAHAGLAMALLAVVPSATAAQNGVLLVRVTGADGPIEGVGIELMVGESVIRSAATTAEGEAALVGLVSGTYGIRLASMGYRPRVVEGIELAPGQVRVLEVRLEQAPVELDPIEVRADRIKIQRDNTEFETTVSEEAIELLPVSYDASRLVALTPGARPDHVWGGANFQANSYRIDGLSANHPGLGGSIIEPNVQWIERVEVRGLGAGAEHGGFQGGQVDVVTKRGTNDFAALVRSGLEHHALAATNLVSTEIGAELDQRVDLEGEVRGPVVRDRLFYYLSGSWSDRSARYLNHLEEREGRYAPTLESSVEGKLFGKLTWTPTRADVIELAGGYLGTEADHFDMTGYEGPGATTRYSAPTRFGNLGWRHALGSWGTVEARVNHFSRDERRDPYQGPDRPGVRLFSLVPPYASYANAPFAYRSAPSSTSARLVNTFEFELFGQRHLVKVGGEYTRGRYLDRRTRTAGMTWMPRRSDGFVPNDALTWDPEGEGIPTEWGGEVTIDADVVNAAGFVQSAISLGRFVLSPGIRWGIWEGWLDPVEGDRFRAVRDQAFDPRIGATLELTADGSLVLKGHWGRYHQDLITQMFDRAAGSNAFTNQEIWNYHGADADPTRRFTEAERDALADGGLFTRESVITLNETGPVVKYQQPYVDQWLVGLEKQFGSSVKLELLYTRRSNRDMLALVDRNRETNYTSYGSTSIHMGGPGGPALPYNGWYVVLHELYVPNNVVLDELRYCAQTGECDPPPNLSFADTLTLTWNPDYILTTAPGAKREFSQLQFTVEIARPKWGASLSAVFTGLEGNLDNVSGYVDPAEFGPGPYVRVNEAINAYGTLPNFSEREAKISVWGMLPWDIRGGLFWTYRSGDHYAPQFRLSADSKYYGYQVNGYAAREECYRRGERCTPGQWGEPLPQSFLEPLEGHNVFIGRRGTPHMRRRALLDARLERRVALGGVDAGLSLDVFNLLGVKETTEIQTMVNHGENYLGGPLGGLDGWPFPINDYYQAPLERVSPRSLRLGVTLYF